jgi:hypothetical protein
MGAAESSPSVELNKGCGEILRWLTTKRTFIDPLAPFVSSLPTNLVSHGFLAHQFGEILGVGVVAEGNQAKPKPCVQVGERACLVSQFSPLFILI